MQLPPGSKTKPWGIALLEVCSLCVWPRTAHITSPLSLPPHLPAHQHFHNLEVGFFSSQVLLLQAKAPSGNLNWRLNLTARQLAVNLVIPSHFQFRVRPFLSALCKWGVAPIWAHCCIFSICWICSKKGHFLVKSFICWFLCGRILKKEHEQAGLVIWLVDNPMHKHLCRFHFNPGFLTFCIM